MLGGFSTYPSPKMCTTTASYDADFHPRQNRKPGETPKMWYECQSAKAMIQAGLAPSASAYSSAIAACSGRAGSRSISLLAEMLSKDLLPTPAAYVGVMAAYEQQDSYDMVLKTFDDMKAQPGCRLTYAAFAAAMRAHAGLEEPGASDTQRRGTARKQLTLFDQMLARHRTQPDAECHSLAARAHATCFQATKGAQVLEEALDSGLTPTGAACEAVLLGLNNTRDGEVSDERRKRLYEASIDGYLPHGPKAARMLKRMTDAGFKAGQDIYERIVRESGTPKVSTGVYKDPLCPNSNVTVMTAGLVTISTVARTAVARGLGCGNESPRRSQ